MGAAVRFDRKSAHMALFTYSSPLSLRAGPGGAGGSVV